MSQTPSPIHPDNCEFLNARNLILSKPCPHCHCTGFVRSHGYHKRTHAAPHASRFFCSNRYSHGGCGRTFSVFWDQSIPYASLDTKRLFKLIECVTEQPERTIHAAFQQCKDALQVSLSTVYRWLKRFESHQSTIRCALFKLGQRPKDCNLSNGEITWRWLKETFADLACPIAAFQRRFQLAFASSSHGRLPGFYRGVNQPRCRIGTATQNDELNTPINTGAKHEVDDLHPKFVHQSVGIEILSGVPVQSLAMPKKIPSIRARI